MIDNYSFGNGQEYCLVAGEQSHRKLLIIAPLFDEANRMRRTLVETMRILDTSGAGSILPDLPGCNESARPLNEMSLEGWQAAVREAATRHGATHVASFRGGALLDNVGLPRWRLAPTTGAKILRAMVRTRIASRREDGVMTNSAELMDIGRKEGIELAGYNLSAAMLSQLEAAQPDIAESIRLVSFGDDEQLTERHIEGSALWLRAEPGYDGSMAQSMAANLAQWMA